MNLKWMFRLAWFLFAGAGFLVFWPVALIFVIITWIANVFVCNWARWVMIIISGFAVLAGVGASGQLILEKPFDVLNFTFSALFTICACLVLAGCVLELKQNKVLKKYFKIIESKRVLSLHELAQIVGEPDIEKVKQIVEHLTHTIHMQTFWYDAVALQINMNIKSEAEKTATMRTVSFTCKACGAPNTVAANDSACCEYCETPYNGY